MTQDECLKYFNCLTKDCTDGPQVEGRPCVGVSLASLFPQLKGEANAWTRFGNEFARAAQLVPMDAAAAVAKAATRKQVAWADIEPTAESEQIDWD